MKTLTLIAAAGILFVGPALADDHGRRDLRPAAPQSIADTLAQGGGTVAGTVTGAGATWLKIADGAGEIDVSARHFLPEGIRTGDPITVTGGVRRGALAANHIVLADGTEFGRSGDGRDRRRGKDFDDDDDN